MPRRRNRVTEHVAVGVAYLSGVAAAFAPPAPTGRPLVDAALLGLLVAVTVHAAASAPWWALAVVGAAATLVAEHPVVVGVGVAGFACALWVGLKRRNLPQVRAVAAGISLNAMAWAQLSGFFGLTALIGIVAGALLYVTGIRRRSRAVRRRSWRFVAAGGALAVVAALGFGVTVADARSSLSTGQRLVRAGISALNRGEFDAAASQFSSAATAMDRAHRQLGKPWGAAGSLVPVVAQHRDAALTLSRNASSNLRIMSAALRQIDPQSLRAVDGRIDLAAIARLGEPFSAVDVALADLGVAVRSASSPWLVAPLADEIDELDAEISENAALLANAVSAVELAPQLLGGDAPRTYLALFTTPSEARGLGGFPGNFAELSIDGGQIEMTDFGRTSELERAAQRSEARIDGPQGFLARYGRFGFDRDGAGLVGNAPFRNVTMTPNFPWVGEVAASVYEQATGRPVDGVFVIDPFVVQALVGYTGPIRLSSLDFRLTPSNAAQFLLRDQYAIGEDKADRVDALEEAAELTIDGLLSGTLPDPVTMARDLGPLIADRRLLLWTSDGAEQELLRRVGLLGEMPAHEGADGWSFAVTNAGANKIDAYLQRTATYESSTDASTGLTTATLTVELTNTAPAVGLPNYVIGNAVGLPPGTSRLYVSFYSPLALVEAAVDGEASGLEVEEEATWNVYSRYVDIPSGGTVTFRLDLAGGLTRPDDLVTWEQPLALPLQVTESGAGQ